MSEMVERVAFAILKEQEKEAFPNNLNLARAAIAAMREPTDNMGIAFWDRYYTWLEDDEDSDDFDLYKVMIDEALK